MKQLGPYRLLAELGAGGMGSVYLAVHRGIGGFEKRVALKTIRADVAGDAQFIRMLVDEARLTVQLTHPGIVQVMDLAESEGTHYIVMEYVDGVTVSDLTSDGARLDLDEITHLGMEAARALAYAHRKKGNDGEPLHIVHRDISGQNLLVSSEGLVKVLDFGIAKAASNRHQTQMGVLKGKLAYMSPEQALGKPLDGRSDLFSLGIVLWELAVGRPLFDGSTDIQTLLQVQKCEVEPPSRLVEGFPEALEKILLHCLAREAEDRYADGDQVADDLADFLRSHAGSPAPRERLAGRVRQRLAKRERPAVPDESAQTRLEAVGATVQVRLPQASEDTAPKMKPALSRKKKLAVGAFVAAVFAVTAIGAMQNRTASSEDKGAVTATVAPLPETPADSAPPSQAEPRRVVTSRTQDSPEEPVAAKSISAKTGPAPAVAASEKSVRDAGRKPSPAPKPAPRAPAKPVVAAAVVAPAPERIANGYLSLNATPWGRVYINGALIAESTPVLKHELPAGRHRVVVVNTDLPARKEIEVNIEPGKHLRELITLP